MDSKKYKQALNLFNEQSAIATNSTIVIAIKACTQLHDYKTGFDIQQKLSSKALNDPYIQTSLIHFYNKLFIYQTRLSS
ncbi:unnamed protein product [Rotaria sp. Silwood1]|nr:unnamed protein product [Rotaria sp. Silwood1]